MRLKVAVIMYEGEPTVYVDRTFEGLHKKLWEAIEESFDDIVGHPPDLLKETVKLCDEYFAACAKHDPVNERLVYCDDEDI